MDPLINAAILFVIATIMSILGWFLRNKNEQLSADIQSLWGKHDEDAAALLDLRLQIAGKHYERSELDVKFEKLEGAFKTGFDQLGAKFDKLSAIMMSRAIDDRTSTNQ